MDNAQTLCSMGGLQLLLGGLNSSDFRLQDRSAFVLGSALARYRVVYSMCMYIDIQWGEQVFHALPILQVFPLTKHVEVCNLKKTLKITLYDF